MIIVPIGWVVGIAGFVWSRKYLRYGIPAAIVAGAVPMYFLVKRAEANAGPYGLRYGYIEIILPSGQNIGTFESSDMVNYYVETEGKDRAAVQQIMERYKNGDDYATGYDLFNALENL